MGWGVGSWILFSLKVVFSFEVLWKKWRGMVSDFVLGMEVRSLRGCLEVFGKDFGKDFRKEYFRIFYC